MILIKARAVCEGYEEVNFSREECPDDASCEIELSLFEETCTVDCLTNTSIYHMAAGLHSKPEHWSIYEGGVVPTKLRCPACGIRERDVVKEREDKRKKTGRK